MVSIARNVNNKNNEEYVVKIIDVAMYLVHSTIPLLKLTMDMFFYFENGNTLLYALTT